MRTVEKLRFPAANLLKKVGRTFSAASKWRKAPKRYLDRPG